MNKTVYCMLTANYCALDCCAKHGFSSKIRFAGRCSILQSCTKIWINLTPMFHFSLVVKNGTSGVDNLKMEHAVKINIHGLSLKIGDYLFLRFIYFYRRMCGLTVDGTVILEEMSLSSNVRWTGQCDIFWKIIA